MLEEGIENAKKSILVIERFMMALAKGSTPNPFAQDIIDGCQFLQMTHQTLLNQIGPEEVEKMKKQFGGTPVQPIKLETTPNGQA